MTKEQRHKVAYIVVDFATTAIAVLCYNVLRFFTDPQAMVWDSVADFLESCSVMLEQALFPPMMLGVYWLSGYYNNVFLKSRAEEFGNTLLSTGAGALLFVAIALINNGFNTRAEIYLEAAWLWGILFVTVYGGRRVVSSSIRRKVVRGEWLRNTLVIGSSTEASALAGRLAAESPWCGLHILGCIAPDADFPDVAARCEVECFVLAPGKSDDFDLFDMLCRLLPLGADIFISPENAGMSTLHMRVDKMSGVPLINVSRPRVSESMLNVKRLSDIVFGCIGGVVTLPIMAALAVAIRLDSRGDVLYRQVRVGRNGHLFNIYKLRSMKSDSEPTGPRLSCDNDPRVTRVGHVMRKYRLDELPQFWNVVRGDMSLVGPRPERPYFASCIMERAPHYVLLQRVRPGLTSMGMVKYGYAGDVDQMIERLRYDLFYLDNISIFTDLKIILYTVRTVITGKGV